ncbi:MAG TPA: S-methyl-5'-thioadenosine phosphorylase, partial [Methylomirabilota bacterium]|nr:S-methyl-5'-thioadenosine phosphorylase [Methylomirabilota bacterium]
NVATAKEVLRRVISRIPAACGQGCPDALRNAVITHPKAFPPRLRKRLDFLLGKYFPAARRGARRG